MIEKRRQTRSTSRRAKSGRSDPLGSLLRRKARDMRSLARQPDIGQDRAEALIRLAELAERVLQ